MTIDWDKPLEAVLEDGTTVPVELFEVLDDGDYVIVSNDAVDLQVYRPDGRAWVDPEDPLHIRNVAV